MVKNGILKIFRKTLNGAGSKAGSTENMKNLMTMSTALFAIGQSLSQMKSLKVLGISMGEVLGYVQSATASSSKSYNKSVLSPLSRLGQPALLNSKVITL